MPIAISSTFDSGAIEVVATDDHAADLRIRHDRRDDGGAAEFLQWFHFRVSSAGDRPVALRIVNAGATTYPGGWHDYRAVASTDRRQWQRVPTHYDGQVLTIELPPAPITTVAYFEPYSWDRHLALVADSVARGARVRRLGSSLQGRDLDALLVGQGRPVWIIARQHPGETMAEWFVEGLLERVLDPADPVARRLLDAAVLFVVPNMNPDGSVRGNLRTNAAGANLNREWMTPSVERSPEVFHVRAAMQRTGVDAFLDVHGDEGLPYVFTDGNERLSTYSPRMAALEAGFAAALVAANPDFQTRHGYPSHKETKVNLTVASKWVGHAYGGLALTLEMPFKDNADLPDPERGWSGARSRRLGADTLTALHAMLPSL